VVRLDQVVRILLGNVTGARQQLIEHPRVGRRPISAHLGWAWAVLQRTGEEPAGGCQIPLLADQDVDDLTELVNSPIQIAPLPRNLAPGFIDELPITTGVPAGPCRLDQQRSESLHPPVYAHRGVKTFSYATG
jgi:hypothetical protein